MTHAVLRTVTGLLLAGLAAGCGGGGGDDARAPEVAPRVDGILHGTLTRSGTTYTLDAIASDGRFLAVDSGGRFYDGTFTIVDGAITASSITIYVPNGANGDAFDHVGYPLESGMSFVDVTATATGLVGGITGSTPATFSVTYDLAADAQDSALALIAGTWRFTNDIYASDLTVSTTGASGTTSTYGGNAFHCGSTGTASLIDPAYGLYAWQATPSGEWCSATAPVSGIGYLSGGTLTILLAGSAQSFALRYVPL
jgi:hypothetical protein